MPYEVTIPQADNTTRIMVPLDVPTALLQLGALELYAMKLTGWTQTVIVDGAEVANPITAVDACAGRIRGLVKEEYIALLANQGAEQGRLAALEQAKQLFGEE